MTAIIDVTGGPSAPGNLTMPDFQALYSKWGDLAKSSRFLVMVTVPPAISNANINGGSKLKFSTPDLTFLCESAELPGRGFMNSDLRYYGPNFKIPYQSTYEDVNMTFLCRDQFTEREFFDNWMEYINPSDTYDFSYRASYIGQVRVYQMSDLVAQTNSNSKSQQRYSILLDRAYPILVNPQTMTWADDNFQRLTITFTYTRWFREGLDTVPSADKKKLVPGATILDDTTGGGTTIPIFNL